MLPRTMPYTKNLFDANFDQVNMHIVPQETYIKIVHVDLLKITTKE